jgi:hypothetical protein
MAMKMGSALYFKQFKWVAMPLVADSNGLPKRPFVDGWQNLTLDADVIGSLPWEKAIGLGIVLGPASDNLAVMDLDDSELGQEAIALCANTRRISTVRNRAHIYVREETPSDSTRFTVKYKGRDVTVELKARGTQVAAPPTPGYNQMCASDMPPIAVPSIAQAWQALATRLGIASADMPSTSGYPRPWQPQVGEGERNNSLFVEACRLKDAGMPLEQALDVIAARLSSYDQKNMPWSEVKATVRSAYRRPSKPRTQPNRFWGGVQVE